MPRVPAAGAWGTQPLNRTLIKLVPGVHQLAREPEGIALAITGNRTKGQKICCKVASNNELIGNVLMSDFWLKNDKGLWTPPQSPLIRNRTFSSWKRGILIWAAGATALSLDPRSYLIPLCLPRRHNVQFTAASDPCSSKGHVNHTGSPAHSVNKWVWFSYQCTCFRPPQNDDDHESFQHQAPPAPKPTTHRLVKVPAAPLLWVTGQGWKPRWASRKKTVPARMEFQAQACNFRAQQGRK